MNKTIQLLLFSGIVLIGLYLAVALFLTLRPEPTFSVAPFPVAGKPETDHETRSFQMRDGERLFARQFPADSDTTILLLHGVTSDGSAFTISADMLRETTGAEVIVLDHRGHGRSGGQAGDVEYIGQYEHDVADVITAIREERPEGRLILAGHSMGGGVALRYALLDEAPAVDGYLLFAPHLGTSAPTMPEIAPEAAEFVAAYTQLHTSRLIGLIMLNSVGIKTLNYLDTLYFNLQDSVTHTYSFRAMASAFPDAHGPVLEAVDVPMLVIVGQNDEAFVAAQFPPTISEYSDGITHIVDGETHNSIMESTAAMDIIEAWFTSQQFIPEKTAQGG